MTGIRQKEVDALVARIAAGDQLALARALTQVESRSALSEALVDAIAPTLGDALRVGITGPPGAGKSTLIEGLALSYRHREHRVGVVAVDPSSCITGGAFLGDRVRMAKLAGDPGVFVRSMASRGRLGGLAPAASGAVDVLEAAGYDRVLIETAGVGQTDVQIAEIADIVVLVLVPESGDGVQGMKAGLIEIADLLVVNKADRDGAETFARVLEDAVALRAVADPPPILLTTATSATGLAELVSAIEARAVKLRDSGALAEKRRGAIRRRLLELMGEGLLGRLGRRIDLEAALDAGCDEVLAGRASPRRVVERTLADSDA